MTITATVIFHREGAFAIPALGSMHDAVKAARDAGLEVEARAILDRPDDTTRTIVSALGQWLDERAEVDFGDLGSARNEGVRRAGGEFLAFLDGDDLWGSRWLVEGHRAAKSKGEEQAIWHPELLYYFDERDFDRQSSAAFPRAATQSYYFRQVASDRDGFDARILGMQNLWSANVFCPRSVHLTFPYRSIDRSTGFGVEDWTWNIETLAAGVQHLVVADAVHMILVKGKSLGTNNVADGLLPYISDSVCRIFGEADKI